MWRVRKPHGEHTVTFGHLDARLFESSDALFDAVRHRRLRRLGAEPIDDGLQAGDLLGLQCRLLREPRLVRRARRLVLAVGPSILDDAPDRVLHRPVEMQHARDRLVQQLEVVADDEQSAAVVAQELEQPRLCVHVEVVGRLVEKQRVTPGKEDPCELHATPLTAGQYV